VVVVETELHGAGAIVLSDAVSLLIEILAQTNPFGPVPTPEPTVAPLPGEDDVSRATLYLIALAVLVAVVALGYFIARDARRSLPRGEREAAPIPDPAAEQRERRARDSKQRSKAKAARRARRHNRPG